MKLYNDTIKAFREHDPIYFARQSFSESDTIGVVNKYHVHPFCEMYILIDGEVDFLLRTVNIRSEQKMVNTAVSR